MFLFSGFTGDSSYFTFCINWWGKIFLMACGTVEQFGRKMLWDSQEHQNDLPCVFYRRWDGTFKANRKLQIICWKHFYFNAITSPWPHSQIWPHSHSWICGANVELARAYQKYFQMWCTVYQMTYFSICKVPTHMLNIPASSAVTDKYTNCIILN